MPTTILWLWRALRVHQDPGLRPIIATTYLQRPRAGIEHCTRRLQRMHPQIAMKTKRCQMHLHNLASLPATKSVPGVDDYEDLLHDNFQHNISFFVFFASGRPSSSVHIKRCVNSYLYTHLSFHPCLFEKPSGGSWKELIGMDEGLLGVKSFSSASRPLFSNSESSRAISIV